MNAIEQYFTSYTSHLETFPSLKMEDYRYSQVLKKISNLKLLKSSTFLKNKSSRDLYFVNEEFPSGFSNRSLSEIPEIYKRSSDFFKTCSLAKHSEIGYILLNKDQMDFTFSVTKGSIMSFPLYLEVPDLQRVTLKMYITTDEDSLAMPVFFIKAGHSSSVDIIYTVDKSHNKGILCPRFEFLAEEESQISFQTFSSHIQSQRLFLLGYCLGTKSHIDIRHASVLKQDFAQDLFVRIFHESKESTSNQMISSVVLDSAQMNFNGQIYANKDAKNIFAYQMLKGMILGEKARIMARPQLDIEYYELACSHGVSIGGFDPEELFYLKTRGIVGAEAYSLLLQGFLFDPFIGTKQEEEWLERIQQDIKIADFGKKGV